MIGAIEQPGWRLPRSSRSTACNDAVYTVRFCSSTSSTRARKRIVLRQNGPRKRRTFTFTFSVEQLRSSSYAWFKHYAMRASAQPRQNLVQDPEGA